MYLEATVQHDDFNDLLRRVPDFTTPQLKKLRHHIEKRVKLDAVYETLTASEEAVTQCPYCQSKMFIRWGSSGNERQRYRCKPCAKTFNALVGSPLYRMRKEELWLEYVETMRYGLSLRKAAKVTGVSLRTAFRWRHAFLSSPRDHKATSLSGIIEADETFLPESFKGKKTMPRPARKRGGGKVTLVPIALALDRSGHITHHVLEHDTKEEIIAALAPVIRENSVLCTDGNLSYVEMVKTFDHLEHKRLIARDNSRVVEGVYHIQTLNNFTQRWKGWLKRFHGVGTAHMDNYLGWFRFMDEREEFQDIVWVRGAIPSLQWPTNR